jgi:cytochrome P450 family 135
VRAPAFMDTCRRRYGDMFTVKLAHEGTWVFVCHPDAVKQVFTSDPNVLHAGEANVILLPVLGRNSVLLLDGKPHMAQRKLMLPPFHGERMQRYEELIGEIAETEIESWPAGSPLQLHRRMQAVTLEVIMRAVFGVRDADRLSQLRDGIRTLLDYSTNPRAMLLLIALGPERLTAKGLLDPVLKPVDELIFDEIRSRRSAPDLAERDDILSLLVQARHEDGSEMSEQELRDELMTLLVAGHETTATALAWAMERLARHPGALDRLREEVDEGEDEYLDAVVKETLRLRPVVQIVVRKLKQPMEIGGRLLPAGASVVPSIYLVHRREDVYPEPRRFRPERFLEQPAGTYTWIPFGGGVRRCLGASFALFEMKTVLAAIVSSLEVRPSDGRSERPVRRAITFAPDRGAEVTVERVARPVEVAA